MRSFTDRYEGHSSRRRGFAIFTTLAVHGLAAFLLLLAWGPAKLDESEFALATFDVGDGGPPSPEPPKPQQVETPPLPPEPVIVPVAQIILPTDNSMPVSVLEQVASEASGETSGQASGGGCDLTGPVQAALRADRQVNLDLPTIAPDRRSVANALALWNGVWIEPDGQFPEAALASIRSTVRATVAAASDACRLQIQRGPRLIYLPGTDRTTVLALGSGKWTWQQVADSSPLQPGEPGYILAGRNNPPSATISKQGSRNDIDRLIADIFGR